MRMKAEDRDLLSLRAKRRGVEGVLGQLSPDPVPTIPFHYGYPFPDSYPLEAMAQAAQDALRLDGADALGYKGGSCAESFSEQVMARSRERDMPTDPTTTIITSGSAQAIQLICNVLLDIGDKVLVEGPTYMGALTLFRNYGADVVAVDLDEDGVRVEAMAERLEAWAKAGKAGPKLFYAIPNFNNPTGVSMSTARRQAVLDLARQYGFLILEDDAYGELRFEGEASPTLRALDTADRVVHVGSMSKILAPGVRLGWAVGPEWLIRRMEIHKADGGTNQLSRAVVGECWRQLDVPKRLDWLRAGYRRRRDAALEALDAEMPSKCTWSHPLGGYFLWLTLPETLRAETLLPEMIQEGVKPLTGGQFFPDGRGQNCFRISYSYPEPDDIRAGIRRMARVIKRHLTGRKTCE